MALVALYARKRAARSSVGRACAWSWHVRITLRLLLRFQLKLSSQFTKFLDGGAQHAAFSREFVFDPNGHFIGRCEMILGLLYKAKKKRALALEHLTEARRIASQFGPTPMLAKIDAALTELR